MKEHTLKGYERLLITLCSLILVVVLFFPIWRIELSAPQYPEGLVLLIFGNKLAGNVDIINGLNHYIGMKPLHTNDFFEFTILPYIISFFAIFLLVVAIIGKRKLLNIVFALFVLFGIIAMIDFWRWDYNYGHNLNPDAAIIVPGMAYQPPLIGYKQLLNFGAYSIPDIGGWLFIGVGVILLILVFLGWKAERKRGKNVIIANLVLPLLLVFSLNSCSTEPQKIVIGKDLCSYCKMPISDNRFGAEIITQKGKAFKFDDVHCLLAYLKAPDFNNSESYKIYFVDFSDNHLLAQNNGLFFLKSSSLRSPMNGNIAVFTNKDSLQFILKKYPGIVLSWDQLIQL